MQSGWGKLELELGAAWNWGWRANRPIDQQEASASVLAFVSLEVTAHIFPGGSMELQQPDRYSLASRRFGILLQ
jgi:hypothetical protein